MFCGCALNPNALQTLFCSIKSCKVKDKWVVNNRLQLVDFVQIFDYKSRLLVRICTALDIYFYTFSFNVIGR